MDRIYIRQVFDQRDLNYFWDRQSSLNWVDGIASVVSPSPDAKDSFGTKVKKVWEARDDQICDLIMTRLDQDNEFHGITAPKSTGRVILSRIDRGGFYKPHADCPTTGDFSTTLFLADPDSYEGGELKLLIDNELKTVKLKAGWAVTYPTGLPHEVTEVTSGSRYAAVFWTKTALKDESLRSIYSQVCRLADLLDDPNMDRCYPLEKQNKHPFTLVNNLKDQIIRRYFQY